MRKRNIQIMFRLNEHEAERLNSLAEKTGYSREALLREMINGYKLCEKPDPEFYRMMRDISAIGNNVNQLAKKANALGLIDDSKMLKAEAEAWHRFQLDLRKKYLLPQRSYGGV